VKQLAVIFAKLTVVRRNPRDGNVYRPGDVLEFFARSWQHLKIPFSFSCRLLAATRRLNAGGAPGLLGSSQHGVLRREGRPMNAPRICKHCNGTTYCSASTSARTGKLKTQPACLTCIVHSGLDPAGIYERVICSVCKGTGLVQLPPARRVRQVPDWMLVTVGLLVSVSLTYFGFVAYFSWRQETKYQGVMEQMREQSRRAARESGQAMRERIHVNMLVESVRLVAGEPDLIESMSDGDSNFELWHYECGKDHVKISVRDGKVQAIYP
jgi:hypothetical protein